MSELFVTASEFDRLWRKAMQCRDDGYEMGPEAAESCLDVVMGRGRILRGPPGHEVALVVVKPSDERLWKQVLS